MKRKLLAACAGIFCLLNANAQTTQVVDISTGVYNNTTTIIPANGTNTDDTWTLIAPTTSTLYSATFSPSWVTSTHAGWVTPVIINHDGYYDDGLPGHHNAGTLQYRMSFTANSCTITQAVINLTEFAGDNTVQSIQVNSNTPHSISATYGSLSSTSVNVLGEVVAGTTNTITITVANTGYSQTGLLVYGNVTIDYAGDAGFVTNITGPTSICDGDALTYNGSTSTGTAIHHVWTVVESNAAGVAMSGATEWWSPFVAGNPGSYTIPLASAGGPTLVCGKYYRIKLARTGTCDAWEENYKVVYINCLPVANAGADKTICEGDCTTIGAGKTIFGATYEWYNPTGYQGAGKIITVCPTTTTTYTVTVTSSAGCSATDAVTVTVSHNDPAFGWTTNTTLSGYFTITSSANNPTLNGYSNPGFTYSFTIEELNSGGTSLYTDGGTDAWWYYPTNDFKGFDGTVNPLGGSYTQTAWWTTPAPAAGKFLYGHDYRITRTTWNDACPAESYAPIISAPPHMNILAGDKIKIYEGQDAIDYVESLKKKAIENASADLNVYPNPSNGMFTIELNNSTKTNMEVYDMLGNKVKEAQITGSYKLDLTGYSKGVYMIKMIVNNKPVMKKIIVE